jgi:hypothetical protein
MNNTTYNIETQLDKVILKLDTIINLLEESNKLKSIESGYLCSTSSGNHVFVDCVSRIQDNVLENEKSFPTPWNDAPFPTCKGDILYKKPENPNWYNIKESTE